MGDGISKQWMEINEGKIDDCMLNTLWCITYRTNFFSGRDIDFGTLTTADVPGVNSSSSMAVNPSERVTLAEDSRLLGRNNCIEMGIKLFIFLINIQ